MHNKTTVFFFKRGPPTPNYLLTKENWPTKKNKKNPHLILPAARIRTYLQELPRGLVVPVRRKERKHGRGLGVTVPRGFQWAEMQVARCRSCKEKGNTGVVLTRVSRRFQLAVRPKMYATGGCRFCKEKGNTCVATHGGFNGSQQTETPAAIVRCGGQPLLQGER